MSIFEAGMMISFGISWPIAAYKTYKAKSVNGKSLRFSFLILLGYIFGITHKFLYSHDIVIWLYFINVFFLLIDIGLHIRYKHFVNKNLEEDI